MFKDRQDFINQYKKMFPTHLGREFEVCSDKERYMMLASLIAEKAHKNKSETRMETFHNEKKNVYYFSLEFLIGRLLDDYLSNFGVRDMVAEGLEELGTTLECLENEERDPGLGNGGLGRLAACFLDSLAALGIAGHGNGIRYRYGLFRQKIENGKQVELADNWLEDGYPWEVRKPENAVPVRFGGEVVRHEESGHFWFTWEGGEQIIAMPYDVPVVGHGGKTVNTLRLWSAEPNGDAFDMEAFDRGDYSAAVKYRSDVEAITYILYPNDSGDPGKVLRLKQEYMFVAAGLSNIVKTFCEEYGNDWERFPELISIHTNDTHPALCAPELMRIFMDEKRLDWDTAWNIVTRTISYTNHTILPEALETWPIELIRSLLPRVYMIIEEIDRRYREDLRAKHENWGEILRNTAILWDGRVRMANLSIIASHSVNGVAALHTEILKHQVLKSFYDTTPEKFNNKTNGVSHRRFLAESNRPLAELITSAIGSGWLGNAAELSGLKQFENDSAFLEKLAEAKRANKVRLADYIYRTSGEKISPDSIFDIQVKRLHAYKRQLLNIFKVMDIYSRILNGEITDMEPCTFLFAGKAAQGYKFAKDVIYLINSVAKVINADPRANKFIKVIFVENFSVSNAQLIYPAADISEQISTAGMEASGTGNMKFMMNGAITLGTLDGANVEIRDAVGEENMAIFGMTADEVDGYRRRGDYYSWDIYSSDDRIRKVVDWMADGTFSTNLSDFAGITDSVLQGNDHFFVLRDFRSYVDTWQRLAALHGSADEWQKISLRNIAASGYFSSDRTIAEYAKDIWHAN